MNLVKPLLIVTIILSLTQCASVKFEKNPPFTLVSATYNHWVGGMPGVSGTKVEIRIKDAKNVVFDSLYFLNKITKVEIKNEKIHTLLIGHYSTSDVKNRNVVLDKNPTKEINNTIPNNYPFQLSENEAVLSYKEGNKIKYYKLSNLKKTAPDLYPEQPK